MMANTKEHPVDAWIRAIPDDPYDLCPCGCGTKWRFVERGGDEEIDVHFKVFEQKLIHYQVFGG